jgi:membrane protein implicated in regulation of membrane protease activity
MLWIGLAALIVGAVSLMIWDAGFWTWEMQVVAFLALALISAFAGKKIMGKRGDATDQPLLNRRGDQLVGRTATLTEPITNGRGRVKIGDTMWRVSGPDLPTGTTVRVKAATDLDLELVVEPV